ncbi:MAG TPA: GNAT family N-acetyltransferase [Ilumatobacteraceae bacterium]|nr:GNAT family N-acetyltransferase [Ilumatobacteraceae bacterium]
MSAALVDRVVRRDELGALATFDRSEHIDGHYVVVDGSLHLVAEPVDVPGWRPDQVAGHIRRLDAVLAAGGVVVGTWDAGALVGLAALDVRPVGGDPATMDLDFVHVSRPHRGRGVARRLVTLLGARAAAAGARDLYISATPSRNTVDAYLRLGARLAVQPDPARLAREPDDIHLLLAVPLAPRPVSAGVRRGS